MTSVQVKPFFTQCEHCGFQFFLEKAKVKLAKVVRDMTQQEPKEGPPNPKEMELLMFRSRSISLGHLMMCHQDVGIAETAFQSFEAICERLITESLMAVEDGDHSVRSLVDQCTISKIVEQALPMMVQETLEVTALTPEECKAECCIFDMVLPHCKENFKTLRLRLAAHFLFAQLDAMLLLGGNDNSARLTQAQRLEVLGGGILPEADDGRSFAFPLESTMRVQLKIMNGGNFSFQDQLRDSYKGGFKSALDHLKEELSPSVLSAVADFRRLHNTTSNN